MKSERRLRRIDTGIGILIALFVLSFWVIPVFIEMLYGIEYNAFFVIAFIVAVVFLGVWAKQDWLYKRFYRK